MSKKTLLLIPIMILGAVCFSQEEIVTKLGINNTVRAFYNRVSNDPDSPYSKKRKKNKMGLTLPFFDDFSQGHIFPDVNLWEDIDVYINSNFSNNPVSYGVATFDGLDSTGYPYNFANPTSYGVADHLTSSPIDLSNVVDSVFLSFYYQPQGNGDMPENRDSLRLEFFRQSDSTWVRVWSVVGSSNHPFRQVMVPVINDFHSDAFQFRFKNWAVLSGNRDHWNVDYIYLNDNRNSADTIHRDVSFSTDHHNMLEEYTSLPWSHYLTDTIGLMANTMDVIYKNNDSDSILVFYKYNVIEDNGTGSIIETYPNGQLAKFVNAGSTLTEPHAVYSHSAPILNDFSFPSDTGKTKVFQIRNYFTLNLPDFHVNNDTVYSYQVFGSYYAYDDGSAEDGFSTHGIGSKLANQFEIKKSDTLTAFQIYFNPITDNIEAETFRLKVWSSLNPEIEIYSQPATIFTSAIYSNTNEFLNYYLDTPLPLNAGTYYFGLERITSGNPNTPTPELLNIGWDKNTNTRNKVFFKINGASSWLNPDPFNIDDGSLMLRPVFGFFTDPEVGIAENKSLESQLTVYPNPTEDLIYFKFIDEQQVDLNVSLIDMYGRVLIETQLSSPNKLNVSNLSNGVYFIWFSDPKENSSIIKKVIISK